jgi:hypothetical protein
LTPARALPNNGFVVLGIGLVRDDEGVCSAVSGCAVLGVEEEGEGGVNGLASVDRPDILDKSDATGASSFSVVCCAATQRGEDDQLGMVNQMKER